MSTILYNDICEYCGKKYPVTDLMYYRFVAWKCSHCGEPPLEMY